MRIVIDMQGMQSESRFRGIGRYAFSLSQAIVRNKGEHEIILALSGLFPHTIEPIRAAFNGMLPQENIRVWYTLSPVKECEPGNEWRREVAETLREGFLASLLPDVVLVTSLFEGYIDDAVTSIGRFASFFPTAVVLYDLIPLLNPSMYLTHNPVYQANYFRKIESLKVADLWLAISGSAAREGERTLDLDSDRIINISTACDSVFRPLEISEEERCKFYNRYNIIHSFVLYSGGADNRKNLPRLIRAYAHLPVGLRQNYQLVLAGKMPESSVRCLRDEAKSVGLCESELIFTGYIADDELVRFYNLCSVFVFPSLHEGFGLPALEAMACGAPVIGANTTSVPEVIGLEEALFDPLDVEAISTKIAHVLSRDEFQMKLRTHGLQQKEQFSWDKSANKTLAALENIYQQSKKFIPCRFNSVAIRRRVVNAVAKSLNAIPDLPEVDKAKIALSIARNHPVLGYKRRIYIDVSELVQRDARTGIQRVLRAILRGLLLKSSDEFVVQAVYSPPGSKNYRQANSFMKKFFCEVASEESDLVVEPHNGDIFVGLDLQPQIAYECREYYRFLRQHGVKVFFVVYDLLPITIPEVFPPGINETHSRWLEVVAEGDGAVCISQSVADELHRWMSARPEAKKFPFKLGWFHLGADIENSTPSLGLPDDANDVFREMCSRPTFLMVGTLEPRKGYDQVLAAFELLWGEGLNVGLVLVGKQGWLVEALVESLNNHSERGNRLFWLTGVSDEYLAKLYDTSTCLLAASLGEGFGLPLIEAAQHKLPIIARDLPVFKEVAGEGAFYFSGTTAHALASSIKEWIVSYDRGLAPSSAGIRYLTWAESVEQFVQVILGEAESFSSNQAVCCQQQWKSKYAEARATAGRQLRVLQFSPYPVRRPRHGGQLRSAAIRQAFELAGFLVKTVGFYQSEAYGSADIGVDDIAFPPDSPFRFYRGELIPALSDFCMTTFSVADDLIFQRVVQTIDTDIDVIVVEQPWFYPLAQRLKANLLSCHNAIVVFSSQNIEAPMKRQILQTWHNSELVSMAVEEISEIERQAAKGADLTVAVTIEDADVLTSYGASQVLVASNGIDPWRMEPEKMDYWRAKLPAQPWPIFIASAHPPNYTGFIEAVGAALACIPPGSKLVVAGGVGPYLQQELSKSRWHALNETRIQVLGVLDDSDLAAVKSLAHAFLLPIGAGGGSNIKTAEALYSNKPVICTSMALRGFEAYRTLPGVWVADTPEEFQAALRMVLAEANKDQQEVEIHRQQREELTWNASLYEIPLEVARIFAQRSV